MIAKVVALNLFALFIGEEKFHVRETYPVELAKQEYSTIEQENLKNLIKSGKGSYHL